MRKRRRVVVVRVRVTPMQMPTMAPVVRGEGRAGEEEEGVGGAWVIVQSSGGVVEFAEMTKK